MKQEEPSELLVEELKKAHRIAVLSGAGMSTESGIPDFRSSTGLYKTVTSEEVFDLGNFQGNPRSFFEIMAPLYKTMMTAKPNAGHLALKALEDTFGKRVDIATQNIDSLHQGAGSSRVYELHGTMQTLTCQICGERFRATEVEEQLLSGDIVRHPSSCHGALKPDIVFYGEMLPEDAFDQGVEAMRKAELVLVLGTSLAVYPAAMLPSQRRPGTPLVIINKTPTPMDREATLVFRDSIGAVLSDAILRMNR